MSSISVLMHHAVESAEYPAGAKGAGEQSYVLQLDQFCEQMTYLHKEGFRTFLLEELLNLEEWPDKAVVLTFDDGHESNFMLVLSLLRKYGFKADFFITVDWIGTPHYMSAEQIKALHDAGMGIGSHGLSHDFLNDMNDIEIERELRESMAVLTRVIERKVVSFSAPGGRLRPGVAVVAESLGYRIVCTSKPGVLQKGNSALSIPRLAVRDDTDIETYKAMVHGEKGTVDKLIIRNSLLLLAKKILGNKGYEQLRRMVLRNI